MTKSPAKLPSATGSPDPKSRIKSSVRKELVARYVALTGLTSTREIIKFIKDKTGKSVDPRTVKQDVEDIAADAESFQTDLARSTWMPKVWQMYKETNQEIAEIQSIMQKILDADPKIPDVLVKQVEQIKDPEQRQATMESLHRICGSVEAQKILGKICYASKVLDEKRAFLISLATSVPLYNKTVQLAKFYEQHMNEKSKP